MLDWIPDQVRDDKTKKASGILVRRVYGGLVRLLPASGWFTSLWLAGRFNPKRLKKLTILAKMEIVCI